MNVLVDTSVWSLALRRTARERAVPDAHVAELAELIAEGRAAIFGAIRQELLSGIKAQSQFDKLRDHLRAFTDLELGTSDYEQAAACFNECRRRGVQGSNTDFLICAVALRHELAIFTTDPDFRHFARHLSIRLHEPRE